MVSTQQYDMQGAYVPVCPTYCVLSRNGPVEKVRISIGVDVSTKDLLWELNKLAPEVGLEPTTLRLTAECSAIELLRSVCGARLGNALR